MEQTTKVTNKLKAFILIESTGFFRYFIEQTIYIFFCWIPSVIGIFLRALFYRLILSAKGFSYIQSGVILKQPRNIVLHAGVFIDHRVYIHACGGRIEIGSGSRIMYGAMLHVYNFRKLPNSKITIGENVVIGAHCIVYGHGGVKIGDNVIIAAKVGILPVNHFYSKSDQPIRNAGISAKGIAIEDDVWIGYGAIITDGVTIGKGSVIGAGSVVTKNIPEYSMAIGSPAKVTKNWTMPMSHEFQHEE